MKEAKKTENKHKKELTGKVVSTHNAKTLVVAVERVYRHPIYKKSMYRTKKIHAHNELSDIKEGDTVIIQSTRPISKLKRFIVVKKVA